MPNDVAQEGQDGELNVWQTMTAWDACAGPVPWQQLAEKLRGAECVGGLHLGRDLGSLALFFPEHLTLLWWCWSPEERDGSTAWLTWAAEKGAVQLCPGFTISEALVREVIRTVRAQYRLQTVGLDRWVNAHVRAWLREAGLAVADVGLGYASLSGPTKQLQQLVADGKLVHGGNPVARMCAAATRLRTDAAGNVKVDKARSVGPIEPIVAALLALASAQQLPCAGLAREVCRHHVPPAEVVAGRIAPLREAASAHLAVILDKLPPSPDRDAAVQHLRSALMFSMAAAVVPQDAVRSVLSG